MTRPLRLEHPGAIWHITARGNRKEAIFLNDADRHRFLGHLAAMVGTYCWRVHAWALMTNHYHLLLETPEPNLSRGMRDLNGCYSQGFNRRHDRVGHVFQGRFKGILVERESHLLELTRYVVLNPVRAGMVEHPDQYPWSSYPDTAGLRPAAEWLEVGWTLDRFGRGRRGAQRRFREFVAEGRHSGYRPWDQLSGQIYLGGETFLGRVENLLASRMATPEVPRVQRELSSRPGIEEILAAVATSFGTDPMNVRSDKHDPARKAFALLARHVAAVRLQVTADVLGITYWSASRLAAEALTLSTKERGSRLGIERARALLSATSKQQT